ncbi:MAG TPA: L-serine ammonia-lyase, iron-sulfur-dependent, subunit alpha [Candidatus Ruminococcus gallistercoris]|nr:L-serine ammonia-lyase, iron-sulfur-dependent, subunit alpha [Candidatus Ruminococcus gallistercoris]
MQSTDLVYKTCVQVLKEELLPAMGCTEPIAIAYAAAVARRTLGALPARVTVTASGNIIKNVKCVFVPNTGGLRGIPAAAAAGIVAGRDELLLEVISKATAAEQAEIRAYLERTPITVRLSDSPHIFDIDIRVEADGHTARARIVQHHTNIVRIEKDGEILLDVDCSAAAAEDGLCDRSCLSVAGILDFVESAALEDIEGPVRRQIEYNTRIAEEGLSGSWGANIGKVLLDTYGNDVKVRARAMAAAGSDARMNGCSLPVVIVSGSGNQGITASLPVVEFAKELGVGYDKTIRAVALSDLITVHLKSGIGRLSAYCGAVSAGCGSGAGIAYLYGGGLREVEHTIVNSIAIDSGIVCDGAKASCAAKIASAVDAGILGYHMYKNGQEFRAGDGLVTHGVEETIRNIGTLAREGMRETDREILHIMCD